MDKQDIYESVEGREDGVSIEPLVNYSTEKGENLENTLSDVVNYLRSEGDTEIAYYLVDNFNSFLEAMKFNLKAIIRI
jgi:hypothetical protein